MDREKRVGVVSKPSLEANLCVGWMLSIFKMLNGLSANGGSESIPQPHWRKTGLSIGTMAEKFLVLAGRTFLLAFMLVLIFPRTGVSQAGRNDPVRVLVSILPQAYFVERIGGRNVSVDVLVLPGKNPATYAPSPTQISNMAGASIYFRIGVPFENVMLSKIGSVAGQLVVVDTRRGIRMRKMETGLHDHAGEPSVTQGQALTEVPGHPQDGEGNDPHSWLDPNLVKQQAATICEALIKVDPKNAVQYRSNLEKFIADLEELDRSIRQTLMPFKGRNLYVFHPSFGYFADAYGLHQVPIEVEGKAPKGKDLYRYIQSARASSAKVIFVQPQFDRNAAEKIAAAIQGEVIALDPLGADYLENMAHMASTIAAAMAK